MRRILSILRFNGGISEEEKRGIEGSFHFSQNLDIHKDPSQLSLLPTPTKVSGSTVTDLIKWIVSGSPYDTNKYFYSEGGKIYKETSGGAWSSLQTTANSNGQGMEVVNDYVYYTQNTQIGRYGPLSGSPAFTDNWQTGLTDTSATKFAPIKQYGAGFVVGHGNKLAYWDGSVWTLAAVTLPAGFNIRSIEVIDEYIVMGTWKGTAITSNEEGYAFFWDGVATTFNFYSPIQEGGINALLNNQNRLISVVGAQGYLYMNANPFSKLQQLPKVDTVDTVEVYPGAVTNWRNMACIGVGSVTSSNFVQGVYQWGSKSIKYPEVLSYAFGISTGTKVSNTVKIGAMKGLGNSLYISWRDNTSYGVDKVIYTDNPAASGTYESMIYDDNRPFDEKMAITYKATHKALREGESVQLGYKINRATNYTTGTANDTDGSTETRLEINSDASRFDELQVECILAQTNNTSPFITSLAVEYDDLKEEEAHL